MMPSCAQQVSLLVHLLIDKVLSAVLPLCQVAKHHCGNNCWSYMQASPLEYWQMLTESTCQTL